MGKKEKLLSAVRSGRMATISTLFDTSAPTLPEWVDGYKLLMEALRNNRFDIANFLLEKRCPVKEYAEHMRGDTPLHLAICRNKPDIVEVLTSRGADLFALNQKNKRPFQLAIESDNIRIAEILINRGVNVNYASNYHYTKGKTPLHEAIELRKVQMAKFLLSKGASVTSVCLYKPKIGFTPLHFAVQTGNIEMVNAILEHHPDVNAQTADGFTPLFLAVLSNNVEIVNLLKNKGGIIDNSKVKGKSVLHAAVQSRNLPITELLLDNGLDINDVDNRGCTPLHIAINCGDKKLTYALLKAGANTEMKTSDEQTALHLACENEMIKIADMLLRFGANINARDYQERTALHIAVENSYLNLLKFLIKSGADVNATDVNNVTPLTDEATDYSSESELLLLQHVIALQAADLPVCEENKLKLLASLKHNNDLKKFQIECEEEVKKLKADVITSDSYVSYYTILTRDEQQITMFLRNKNLLQVLQADNYCEKFPIYSWRIKNSLKIAFDRIGLLEKGIDNFNKVYSSFPPLPLFCVEKIFSNISNQDLKVFIGEDKDDEISLCESSSDDDDDADMFFSDESWFDSDDDDDSMCYAFSDFDLSDNEQLLFDILLML